MTATKLLGPARLGRAFATMAALLLAASTSAEEAPAAPTTSGALPEAAGEPSPPTPPTPIEEVAPTAAPVPPGSDLLAEYPFRSGERLTYDITVLGAVAGRGTLSVGKPRTWNGVEVLPVHGMMASHGFWDNVYRVRNRMLSLMPRQGAYPLHTEMSLDQNGASRDMSLDFDPATGQLRGERSENKGETKKVTAKVPAFTQDALSWFYHLRSRTLTTGSGFSFKGYSGKFVYTVYCRIGEVEEVWTRVGMLPAYRIEADIRRDGNKDFRRNVTFWIGNDADHLPIKMSFDFTVGRVEGILTSAVLPPRTTASR
ncbi:MAG: hypothetical protein AMXMBFR64_21780 [Myxococcales bacterium]